MSKKPEKRSIHPPSEALKRVEERAIALAGSHGLVIDSVTFGPTDFGLTLTVTVMSAEEGRAVSVTDCELISRPLSKELDMLLADFSERYLFEVASKGIELSDDTD